MKPDSAFEKAIDEFFRNRCSPGASSSEWYRDIYREAWNAALDAAREKIRAKCGPCEGTGHEDARREPECQYCGRPREALSSLRASEALSP